MGFKAGLNSRLKGIINNPYPFETVERNRKKAIDRFGKDYIIDFSDDTLTYQPPATIRERCKRAIDERKDAGYQEGSGCDGFKMAVCDWMKSRFNLILSKEEVVATYGVRYSCFHIPLYFINSGKKEIVLIPNPGYSPYTEGTLLAGGIPYYLNILEENNFEPYLEKIKEREAEEAALFFLNSPHNPTGKIYSDKKLREIVDFCLNNNIILVSDECYSELYFKEKPKSILGIEGAEQCSIVLNSLSESGMMSSYAIGFFASKNPGLLQPFKSMLEKSVPEVAPFIQDAATAFSSEMHWGEMRKIYSEKADALIPALKKIGCQIERPEGTFYLWVKIPENTDPVNFSEKLLLKKGISCMPGNLISHTFNGINPGAEYVRFALVPSIERVREAAKRLVSGK